VAIDSNFDLLGYSILDLLVVVDSILDLLGVGYSILDLLVVVDSILDLLAVVDSILGFEVEAVAISKQYLDQLEVHSIDRFPNHHSIDCSPNLDHKLQYY
jgi:hypothetical protein